MPLRSPDLTPMDFSSGGFIKGGVYVIPLLLVLEELRSWNTEVCAKLTVMFSESVAGS
jgi:hypothetical protein